MISWWCKPNTACLAHTTNSVNAKAAFKTTGKRKLTWFCIAQYKCEILKCLFVYFILYKQTGWLCSSSSLEPFCSSSSCVCAVVSAVPSAAAVTCVVHVALSDAAARRKVQTLIARNMFHIVCHMVAFWCDLSSKPNIMSWDFYDYHVKFHKICSPTKKSELLNLFSSPCVQCCYFPHLSYPRVYL